jgi:hypothetical protein
MKAEASTVAAVSHNMLLPGLLGMLAGLMLDARGPGPQWVASLCGAGATSGLLRVLCLHWSGLPAMHIGMVCAVLGAVPLRRLTRSYAQLSLGVELLRHTVCLAWMILGMAFGPIVCEWVAINLVRDPSLGHNVIVIIGSMFVGMIGGMSIGAIVHAACRQAVKIIKHNFASHRLIHHG